MAIKIKQLGKVYDTPSELKEKCIKWLTRIGVRKEDIDFDYMRSDTWAEIFFIYDGKEYNFKSVKQNHWKSNLKALELFVHSRVLTLERGIETFEKAFSGYKQIENKTHKYFNNIIDINDLRYQFKEWCKKLHPDIKKNDKQFNEMIVEYETFKKKLGYEE